MKYLLSILIIMGSAIPSYGIGAANGFCETGNQPVTTSGLNSTTRVQRSFPSCTITVFLSGTTTLATIYSDARSTPLGNPFTAKADGSWIFFAANGTYDVSKSGAGLTPAATVFSITILDAINASSSKDCSSPKYGTGSDIGRRINACLNDFPMAGGTADARGFTGNQTMSTNIFNGITKPITLLLGAATYTISVQQTLTSNNSTIRCEGTTLVPQTGANFSILQIAGTDDTFEDCVINDQPPIAGQFTYVITFNGSNRALVRHNTINNLAGFGLYIGNATNPRIVNNSFFGSALNTAKPVGVQTAFGDVHDLFIEGNRIDVPSGVSSGEPIQLSTSNVSDVGRVTVTGNSFSTGSGFCFEAGTFGGGTSTMHDITATGNSCRITGNGTFGGFSSGGSSATSPNRNIIFSNNIYDGGGFTSLIGAFEIATVDGFAVTGNTIENTAGLNSCVNVDGFNNNGTVTGNSCAGFATTGEGIYVGTNDVNGIKQKITVSGNTIIFPSAGTRAGIHVQCNGATTTCRNIVVTGNVIFGNGTANSVGIQVESNSGGTMDNVVVSGNSIYKTSFGINVPGTAVNALTITNNVYDAANSAATFGILIVGASNNINISNNTITSLNAGVIAYTIATGIQIVNDTDAALANNVVNGVNATDNGKAGISVYNTAGTTSRITVNGNTINTHGVGNGLLLDCFVSCTDVSIQNNNLVGDGTAGGLGITSSGTGTIQRLSVANNQIQNYQTCIYAVTGVVGRITNNSMPNCANPIPGYIPWPNIQFVDFSGMTLAFIPAMLANGSMIYITDATITNPCAGGGTGAILKVLNGVRVCN